MKFRYNLLLILCVTFMAATFYLVGMTLAHHHRFLATDEGKQKLEVRGSWVLPENHMSANWALSLDSSSVKYFIENPNLANPAQNPTVSSVGPLVRTAVAGWETAIPELDWGYVNESTKANVVIKFEACKISGLFRPHNLSKDQPGWYDDPIRKAGYWHHAEICINSWDKWLNDDAILSIISHELGHAYGLHEGYFDDPATPTPQPIGSCFPLTPIPTPTPTVGPTIMDSSTNTGGPHCDGLTAPSQYDIDSVEDA